MRGKTWCIVTLVLVIGPGAVWAQQEGADSGMSRLYERRLDRDHLMYGEAYQLDAAQKGELRKMLFERYQQQEVYEETKKIELQKIRDQLAGSTEVPPQQQAAIVALATALVTDMPMREEVVTGWLDQRVTPEVAAQAKVRLQELRHRKNRWKVVNREDNDRIQQNRRRMAENRRQRQAQISEAARPQPAGDRGVRVERERGDPGRVVQLDAEAQKRRQERVERMRRERPDDDPPSARGPRDVKPAKPAAKPLLPAPPLDEWDKYVAAVAKKYEFTEAQNSKAQSILRDLRKRAQQYRLSRAKDFDRAEKLTDKKERDAKLKTLNEPLDAMFDELKQRLESLPTIEQKLRAEKAGDSKKKDSTTKG